jgi:KDO2-lipid IV(A) lauroyltransferase
VRDALAQNRVVALLIDQDRRRRRFCSLSLASAHTPPGAAILALRTKAPVVSVFIHRRPEGGHTIVFDAIPIEHSSGAGRVLALTAQFTAAIEAAIRRSPAEWVWWHERWRRQPEASSTDAVRDAREMQRG